jgi:hypothetical protein
MRALDPKRYPHEFYDASQRYGSCGARQNKVFKLSLIDRRLSFDGTQVLFGKPQGLLQPLDFLLQPPLIGPRDTLPVAVKRLFQPLTGVVNRGSAYLKLPRQIDHYAALTLRTLTALPDLNSRF